MLLRLPNKLFHQIEPENQVIIQEEHVVALEKLR